MTTAQNGAKNKPAPGDVTVSETPSANVNVLVENTCPHRDLFWVISVYKAAIHPICATRPLIISTAVASENTFTASSSSCESSPRGAASATDPSAGSIAAALCCTADGETREQRAPSSSSPRREMMWCQAFSRAFESSSQATLRNKTEKRTSWGVVLFVFLSPC